MACFHELTTGRVEGRKELKAREEQEETARQKTWQTLPEDLGLKINNSNFENHFILMIFYFQNKT